MKLKKLLYISAFSALTLPFGGCADDDYLFGTSGEGNANVISFEANTARGVKVSTRNGENTLYDPLVLQATEGESKLYLHTFVTDKIGFKPGEEGEDMGEIGESEGLTRGYQVDSAESLITFHGNYKVMASREDGSAYFGWVNARNTDSERNVWHTDRAEYWPGKEVLTFTAVSPASEFSALKNLRVSGENMSFRYTVPTGSSDNDAEAQQDLLLSSGSCSKSESISGRAPLKFYHALSAVKFAVRDVANGEIENIRISGVRSEGDCALTVNPSTGGKSLTWSNLSGNAVYSQNFNYKITGLGAVDAADESADILLNSEMPEKTFMVIPQEIPAEAELIVTVKRTGMTPERIELRGKIRDNLVSEWLPGHEYIYTISTSGSNWIYVFNAYGNRNSTTGAYGVSNGDQIYVYSPSAAILDADGRATSYPHDTYGDNAVFYVRSFRYHANDQTKKEKLVWKATHGAGKQYRVLSATSQQYVSGRDLTPEEWVTTRDALTGEGSYSAKGEKKTLSFATHHQITDWPGDIWMQDNSSYVGNSKSTPWDLSTCGGVLKRNTANSYVIDREGWYCFPLVYGNAIKDGNTNKAAYKYQGTTDTNHQHLVNHSGAEINDPWITFSDTYTADIVWSDVYNTVTDVEIVTINGDKMIRFKANKHNMQQGSVVIALYSGNSAIWSWQIWITEHWLDHSTGQPNAFKSDGKFASWEASSTGWRQRGDLLINNSYVSSSSNKYYISPYNLGWCDPKNVDYLRRPSTMEFVQYDPSGKPTGKTASLKMLQDGERVSYKYGNNTYYQWGRKDAIVGFVDHTQTVKRNFGPKKYAITKKTSGVDIKTAIANPHEFYYGFEDWSSAQRFNYWNNSTNSNKGIKTVYDPCPPGYMVPPRKVFEFIGKDNAGNFNNAGSNNKNLNSFNGSKVDEYTFKACVGEKSSQTDQNSVWLTSTGNRWWDDSTVGGTPFKGGDNFNAQIVYLWSSLSLTSGSQQKEAYGLSLGLDKYDDKGNNQYVICAHFPGRKTMARPVRPIREM